MLEYRHVFKTRLTSVSQYIQWNWSLDTNSTLSQILMPLESLKGVWFAGLTSGAHATPTPLLIAKIKGSKTYF